jgi:hypothetical protein
MLKYSAFKAAILATEIERANADPIKSLNKNWQDEIEKVKIAYSISLAACKGLDSSYYFNYLVYIVS